MTTLNDAKIRITGTSSHAVKEGDGAWKVIVSMVERVSFDGVNFEEKKIEKMSIDKSYKDAFDTAFMSVLLEAQEKVAPDGSMFLEYTNDSSKVNEVSKA